MRTTNLFAISLAVVVGSLSVGRAATERSSVSRATSSRPSVTTPIGRATKRRRAPRPPTAARSTRSRCKATRSGRTASAHAGDILQKSFKGTLPALKNGKPNGGKIKISKNQKVGKPITLDVDAPDPDHDPISYAARAEGDPKSPRQHASTFHFTFDKAGKHKATISIADNKGGAIKKTVTIHVTR